MDKIAQFIQNDFPLYTQINGPQLVAFIAAYYEWLEQSGNIRDYANNLREYRDIDSTLPEFITHFQYEYLNQLPADLLASKPLLIKHVLDLYRAKGTRRGIALLFRILFNEDVEIYLPGNDAFRTSAAHWVQPTYVEVSDCVYLDQLVGCSVYSLNGGATALVERYDTVRTSNKVINVMFLSNVVGSFLYGDSIMSNEVSYTPEASPHIVGSLSSVTIDDGGTFFNIGDIVSIKGTGSGALGRVSTTTSENGKVTFTLNDGGFGFSLNADVQVIPNGSGSGALFTVGSLVNQQTYSLNIDIINTYYNEQLDISSAGFTLVMANYTGSGIFLVGHNVNCACSNSVDMDFSYISGLTLSKFETLSNASLGIAVSPIIIDDPSYVRVTGTNANLVQLTTGSILQGSVSGCVIHVNSVMPIQQNACNGTITQVINSTAITITGSQDGYPMPTSIVTGDPGVTANVQSVIRNTNWAFPVSANTNMDTPIGFCLTTEDLVIGTIASLASENPGDFYAVAPTVIVTEPDIAALKIDNGRGGVWGADANVTANAIFANGVVTSVQIIDSGVGFAKGESIEMSIDNNSQSIRGFAVTEGTGISQGYWTSNPSGTSDTSKLQDSYYYQNYSYELIAGRALDSYQKLVEDLMGPIGYVMFGKYAVNDTQNTSSEIEDGSMSQPTT